MRSCEAKEACTVVGWHSDGDGCFWIHSTNPPCSIWIGPRPNYCDRGNWLAHLEPEAGPKALHIDGSDLWPRYYFDLERAKLECEAWLEKRAKKNQTTRSATKA